MDKDVNISFLRCVAIVFILICHICQGYDYKLLGAFFNIGVQIFLLISGYLYGLKAYVKIDLYSWYKKRIVRIFIPYAIFLTVYFLLVFFIFCQAYSVKEYMICFLGLSAFYPDMYILGMGHLWYISIILFCYLITPFMQKCNMVLVAIISLLLMYSITNRIEYVFWVGLYILGYLNGSRSFSLFKGFALSVVILSLLLVSHFTTVKWCAYILSHYLISLSFFYITMNADIIDKIYNKFKYVFNHLDKISYCVYLVHLPLILGTFAILYLTRYAVLNIALIFVISIILGTVLFKISDVISRKLANNVS